jgi:hypothetical protein
MDAKQCRRAWLQKFLDELGGKRNELARLSGVAGPQITQVLNGDRGMGDQVARRLETWKKLPRGTLDRPPGHHVTVQLQDMGEIGHLSPEEEVLVIAWRALPPSIREHIHLLCTEYAARLITLPELRNGDYKAAEKANAGLEAAQRKARKSAKKPS